MTGSELIGFIDSVDFSLLVNVPLAEPDDETGFFVGAGFAYALTDRIGIGLTYRRDDTRVVVVETVGMELTLSF